MANYKMIGREPTEEMLEASWDAALNEDPNDINAIRKQLFRAMWDAAPQVAGLPEGWVADAVAGLKVLRSMLRAANLDKGALVADELIAAAHPPAGQAQNKCLPHGLRYKMPPLELAGHQVMHLAAMAQAADSLDAVWQIKELEPKSAIHDGEACPGGIAAITDGQPGWALLNAGYQAGQAQEQEKDAARYHALLDSILAYSAKSEDELTTQQKTIQVGFNKVSPEDMTVERANAIIDAALSQSAGEAG